MLWNSQGKKDLPSKWVIKTAAKMFVYFHSTTPSHWRRDFSVSFASHVYKEKSSEPFDKTLTEMQEPN